MADLEAFFDSSVGLDVIVVRLLAAALLGAIVGFDREYLARPAGLRTHVLVTLAACTLALLTTELTADVRGDGIQSDPIRIIEAVTAGVAFLAAGSIIVARGQVHGLTTGASLWLCGAVGVGCGMGYFFISLLATILATFVLVVLRWAEVHIPRKAQRVGTAEGVKTEKPSAHQ